MAERKVHLKIRRQDAADRPESARWEEFQVPLLPQMNVISALQQIQLNPVTPRGQRSLPGGLGLRLPGRGLRRLHHDHQWTSASGLLGAHRADLAQRGR